MLRDAIGQNTRMSPVAICRCAWLLAIILPLAAVATPVVRGVPLMQRFTPEDYPAAPSHLSVTEGVDGAIYVGNVEGVLRYAGGQWQRFELPGNSAGRSLVTGRDGRVYVGGYDHFGVLIAGEDGSLRYEDLRSRFDLEGDEADIGDVWTMLETPLGLYIRASQRLFFLGHDGSTRQWPMPAQVRGFSVLGEALIAREPGVGIVRFEDGRLVPVPGAAAFADIPLVLVASHPRGTLLASTLGFLLATPRGIEPLPSDADAAFAAHPPYQSHILPDGSYVFGSFDGVLMRFSPELKLLDQVKLGSYTLTAFSTDREGGLWVTSEGDLVRIKLPSPWTAYTDQHGIVGSLTDSAWYDDTLWLATSVDIMRARRDAAGDLRFEPLAWTHLEAFDLEPSAAGLLIGEREGLQVLDRGHDTPRRLTSDNTVYLTQVSKHDPAQAFALADNEVVSLVQQAGRWEVRARWPLQGMNPDTFIETAPGELWLDDSRGAPQRWRLDLRAQTVLERTVYDSGRGLEPDRDRGSALFLLDDVLHAASGARGFRLDGERFVASDLGALAALERRMEIATADTPLGTYAWTSRQLLHRAPGASEFRSMQIDSRLARGFVQAGVDADGMLRVITWNALLQFDPAVPEPPLPQLQAALDRVSVRGADSIERTLPLRPQPDRLLAPNTAIAFHFGLVSMEPDAEFRYRMLGHSDAWSEWRDERDLIYRSLPPGSYELQLQARTASGREATPFAYPLRVPPPWYQTPWAWTAAGVLGLLAVVGITQLVGRLRYQQFVATRRKLERKISERTAELEEANRKLAELATEDSLTGVPNRRALEQALAREWQRCAELQQPLAVLMIDVDHFKLFNDRHGHLEGDRQLHWVAQQLSAEVTPVRELVARFGGEEFAVVLPGLHLEEAAARAERMRARFLHDGSPLTISAGVAVQVPAPDSEPQQLLRRADTALYRAKRKGRNRVETAED
jgi:diguanylate cyclase (GGDEF)-like protein